MRETTLLYIAALLNQMVWRYSYGRKCFRTKLENIGLIVPVTKEHGEEKIDEDHIAALFPQTHDDFSPNKLDPNVIEFPTLNWHAFNIKEILELRRGDFHSISALAEGKYMTVSRTSNDNGVRGYFELPDKAQIYTRGHITVSTVGGDAFVQFDDFIATDNVIICAPKSPFRITSLFFIAMMLNHQKWRYGYGRQCYLGKLERVLIYLPITEVGRIDEDAIESIVKQAPYWPQVEQRFQEILVPFRTDQPPIEQLTLSLD